MWPKTQWLVLSSSWEERLPTLGTPNLSFIHILHAEWRPWVYLLEKLSQPAWHPNWECGRTSRMHLSPVEAGPSCCWHSALPLCCQGNFSHVWEVSARLRLLRSKAIKMLSLLPLGTKRLSFQGHHNFICVESNYPKNMKEQRDCFFSLLIPLHLSFASVKWEQYTAAHKREGVCCIPHESCKCCVMSHILVKCMRKQAILLSELSLIRGGKEKAERFFWVRMSKESTE